MKRSQSSSDLCVGGERLGGFVDGQRQHVDDAATVEQPAALRCDSACRHIVRTARARHRTDASTTTSPAPSQSSQRPPATLKLNQPGPAPNAFASRVAAKRLRMPSNALLTVAGFERALRPAARDRPRRRWRFSRHPRCVDTRRVRGRSSAGRPARCAPASSCPPRYPRHDDQLPERISTSMFCRLCALAPTMRSRPLGGALCAARAAVRRAALDPSERWHARAPLRRRLPPRSRRRGVRRRGRDRSRDLRPRRSPARVRRRPRCCPHRECRTAHAACARRRSRVDQSTARRAHKASTSACRRVQWRAGCVVIRRLRACASADRARDSRGPLRAPCPHARASSARQAAGACTLRGVGARMVASARRAAPRWCRARRRRCCDPRRRRCVLRSQSRSLAHRAAVVAAIARSCTRAHPWRRDSSQSKPFTPSSRRPSPRRPRARCAAAALSRAERQSSGIASRLHARARSR